jgi:hypothetical protein
MHHTRRYVASLFLAAALAGPMSIMAVPPQGATVQVRVYDRSHKDYHNWDGRENQAWGVYLTNNHQRHYEYARANRRQQDQYWNWRHSHPDGR